MATKNNVIDTGLVKFELPFDRGVEEIYFNPNDVEFFYRITNMINSISKLYDGLTEEYEKAKDEFQKIEILHNLNDKIKSAFDVAFGNSVADVIFKYVSPHGIVAGDQYYCFYIIEYLIPKISEISGNTSNAAAAALEKAMNKHAVKYQHKIYK